MKVMKFGGTSVGSAERIRAVASLIAPRGRNVIVLSAMSGTTNSLLEIASAAEKGDIDEAREKVRVLREKYRAVVEDLFDTPEYKQKAIEVVEGIFAGLTESAESGSERLEKEIVACGELLSTNLFTLRLRESGVKAVLIPALDFMRLDASGEPDLDYIAQHLIPLLKNHHEAELFITQGFICRNGMGQVDNLQRGGSDYTASLIGAAIGADEVEIWTDIDGMHNNDPRFVEGTRPVHNLHFNEAAELAYFGAKILHPTCILPARNANIPVRLLNTMEPDAPGTLIDCRMTPRCIKAVAAKDGITAIKIKSGRMLLAYGFLKKVFEIFERHRTPIDMITTSEVGVSLTVDNPGAVDAIVAELAELGDVTIDRDMVIICVVGDLDWHNKGFESAAMQAMNDIPVRMISYGGSNYNISFLVRKEDKVEALRQLSACLFN